MFEQFETLAVGHCLGKRVGVARGLIRNLHDHSRSPLREARSLEVNRRGIAVQNGAGEKHFAVELGIRLRHLLHALEPHAIDLALSKQHIERAGMPQRLDDARRVVFLECKKELAPQALLGDRVERAGADRVAHQLLGVRIDGEAETCGEANGAVDARRIVDEAGVVQHAHKLVLEIALSGANVWVAMQGEATVVRVSATSNLVLGRIHVADTVYAVAATATYVLVTNVSAR